MALIFMDGFNHYATADITKKWNSNVGATISSGTGRRSGNSLRTSGYQQYVTKTFPNAATVIVGAAFTFSSFAAGTQAIIALFEGGVTQCDVRINTTGTLSVTRNGTALTGGTSTLALSVNTPYYIEFKVTIADSIAANSCKVRVNNVDWITVATGQDTKNTANAFANQLLIGQSLQTFNSIVLDVGDLYLCDGTGTANNDFLGDVRIDTLLPNGDGTYSQFTPSTGTAHAVLVDETTPNTTDYNDGVNVGDRDSYAMANLTAIASQTVYGVQVNAAALKDDAGAKSVATMVRSGGTNGDGASAALGTTQTYVSQIFEKDPNGAVAWTESSINAMEAGVVVTA